MRTTERNKPLLTVGLTLMVSVLPFAETYSLYQ